MSVRTSNHEAAEFLQQLGLDVSHDEAASAELDELFAALVGWYRDEARAMAARVFSWPTGSDHTGELRKVLSIWARHALPAFDREDLVSEAADLLFIAADHATAPATMARLFSLEGDAGTLYLLRPENGLPRGDAPWELMPLESPDLEAALHGVFREDGCTSSYVDHARGCERCQAMLAEWERNAELPEAFAALRDSAEAPLFREPLVLPPSKPWWKFW